VKRGAGSGKREEGSGKREEGSGKREEGSGKREAGSGEQEAGSGKRFSDLPLYKRGKQNLVPWGLSEHFRITTGDFPPE